MLTFNELRAFEEKKGDVLLPARLETVDEVGISCAVSRRSQ